MLHAWVPCVEWLLQDGGSSGSFEKHVVHYHACTRFGLSSFVACIFSECAAKSLVSLHALVFDGGLTQEQYSTGLVLFLRDFQGFLVHIRDGYVGIVSWNNS